jgi:hypothetical protein
MRVSIAGPALLALLAFPSVHSYAGAQEIAGHRASLLYRVDLYAATRERWRGIRRNATPVAEVDGLVGAQWRGLSVTAGAWAMLEIGGTGDEVLPELHAGDRVPSQWTGWVQGALRYRQLTLTTGVTRDWYVRGGRDPRVTEVFATARAQVGRWMPSIAFWQAVDGAGGGYLEPALSVGHFVNPFTGPAASWITTVRGGFQIGHRDPEGGASVPGPEGTGLTHVAVGTQVRLAFNITRQVVLVASTGPEVQINRDPATKRHRDGSSAGSLRVWWPLQAGFSWPLRRPE